MKHNELNDLSDFGNRLHLETLGDSIAKRVIEWLYRAEIDHHLR